MFNKVISLSGVEVSHKRIENPVNTVYYNHMHDHAEMVLFLSGNVEFNVDGKLFKPQPFDLLFIPSAVYHHALPTGNTPYENYVIDFIPSLIENEKHLETLFSTPLILNVKEEQEVLNFFSRLDFYFENYSEEDFNTSAFYLIKELIIYCSYMVENGVKVKSGKHTHLEEIIKFINQNLEKKLDALVIAKAFNFSKSYVQNIFSANMKIGLKKYVMQKKIYAAKADLDLGLSASAVCEKYCFYDYSVFYRNYKKTFKRSPKNR